MKFSLYSELQSWPGKPAAQLYGEVLEQIVNADRLGYAAYAVIEHFFFPKFSISANPLALFAAAAQRTRRIVFRTLLHSMPYHNPVVLASEIAVADILLDGRYEFGVGRGHGWMPPKAGLELTPESRERYEESVELLFTALENERFSYQGKHFQVADSGIVPRPDRKFRVFLGGTSDRTYELAGERGWAVVVPPLLPYEALQEQLDLYRATCAEHGNEPDIVWIHACYIDEDREVAKREAEQWMVGFLKGNASPLTDYAPPPAEELIAAGYGFYTAGILEKLAETPYDEMIAGDIVWVGNPQDVIERIETVKEVCDGLTEISITVNAGGAEHWQAIKTQELFAATVMPHFQAPARKEVAAAS
ncbi:MAG TPA: LLM class flavin-dependent oxidoreductase [Gaiellaceae bacterium]|nr:LLM class flavin-dependent oxidoreductase [Gaiellaceae bacterium]